jgi:hypothetical protein
MKKKKILFVRIKMWKEIGNTGTRMTQIRRMNTPARPAGGDFFCFAENLDFLNHPKSCEAG